MRSELDFYATPEWVTKALLERIGIPHSVLDPFAGDGAILKVCEQHGVTPTGWELDPVRSKELQEYGIKTTTMDAFMYPWIAETIITNPPYSRADEAIGRATDAIETVSDLHLIAMLLRLNVLGGQKRRKLWQTEKRPDVFVLSKRPSFTGKGTDSAEYAWFVFSKLSNGGHWEVL